MSAKIQLTNFNHIISFSIILALLSVFSCAKPAEIKKGAIEPYTGTVTVDVLKKSIGFRNTRSLKAFIDIKVYRNEEFSGSFGGVFGYESTGKMKASFFGPFGITAMEFLISEDLVQLHIPPKGILYEARTHDLSFNAMLNNRYRYNIEEDKDMLILYAYPEDEKKQDPVAKFLFDREYLLNRSIIFFRDGFEFIRVEFGNFNGEIPESLRIYLPKNTLAAIDLKESEVNNNIPEEYFLPISHGDLKIRPFQEFLKRLEPRR